MKKKQSKGAIIAGFILTMVAYALVMIIVAVFFYMFKYHVTLTVRDEYVWNKVQEIPLSLMSMNFDREKFIIAANKVYYGDFVGDRNEFFIKPVRDNITKQLFYNFEAGSEPFGYALYIFNYTVAYAIEDFNPGEQTGCGCTNSAPSNYEIPFYKYPSIWYQGSGVSVPEAIYLQSGPSVVSHWVCNDNCVAGKKGEYCGSSSAFYDYRNHLDCYDLKVKYEMEYPLPLVFNGSESLVNKLLLDVVELYA